MWRPKIDISEYFSRITPLLQRWCTLREACLEAKVPYTTVWDYMKWDKEFSDKIEALQNIPIVLARTWWIEKIKKWDYTACKDYLERKKPKEFAPRFIDETEWNKKYDHLKEKYKRLNLQKLNSKK